LQTTEYNPSPTMMPPPGTGLAGAIGERHVICFVGLPARGKQFMAERLCRYLKFFHGAQCKIFDLAIPKLSTDEAVGDALGAYLEEEDETATTQLLRSLEGIEDDSLDRLKKNVDSGKIAIIDTSDAFKTQRRAWAGTSKETRWAMQKHLTSLRVRVKLLFIEVIVTETNLVRRFLRQRLAVGNDKDQQNAATNKDTSALEAKVDAAQARIKEFGRSYVTIQDDGSEDDLAYVKLINYGDKVVTNKIRGFLLMQIVKYLSHVHPNPRMVYLCRHGQSQYNIQQKIGGNPGITESGERFAKWLGTWVPANIWTTTPSSSEQLNEQGKGKNNKNNQNKTKTALGSPRKGIDEQGDGIDTEEDEEDSTTDKRKKKELNSVTLQPSTTLEILPPLQNSLPAKEPLDTLSSTASSNTKALAVAGANDICGANLHPDDEAVDPNTGRPLFGRIYEVYDVQTKTSRPAVIRPTRLWTSTLKRTIDTARHIPHPVLELRGGGVWHQMLPRVYRNLDEIFAGDYEGMTYKEIERNFGEESILRKKDKLGYRYPRGESYLDLIARLDPLMHELESYVEPLLVVSHQATLRIIYAYLVGLPRADAPKIDIPLHTVIRISWDGWQSFEETRFAFDEHDFQQVSQNDGQQFL